MASRSEAQKLRRERERRERRSLSQQLRRQRESFVPPRLSRGNVKTPDARIAGISEQGQTPGMGPHATGSDDSVGDGERRHLAARKCDGWVRLTNGVQLRCWMHSQKAEAEFDDHVGRHWSGTPCLCSCHFTVYDVIVDCDDRECAGVSVKRADPNDWHAWDTDEVCNADRQRTGQFLISRRACRSQEHSGHECRSFFEGAAWNDPKRGPAAFPNRAAI